jgi:hypothetical protein
MCPQPQTCCLFISAYFTDFDSTSHMPPTDLCFQTSPKSTQEKLPTLSTESTSRQHKSSHVERLGSLRELTLFVCLRTAELSCSPCLPSSAKLPSLVVRPCSYMDSKGHLCETSCLLGVSHPFMNRHTQPTVAPLRGPSAPI